MSRCTFTFSANTGGVLHLGPARVWYDALHHRQVPPFSTLSPQLLAQVEAHPDFAAPDVIFHSHCHPDHFSRSLLRAALERWPRARAFLPEARLPRQVLLIGQSLSFSVGGLRLRFRQLPHESTEYAAVPHYGCLIRYGDFRVLLTGDCAVAAPALAELIGGEPIDLALVDFVLVADGRTLRVS